VGATLNDPTVYIDAVLNADLDIEPEANGHAGADDSGDPVAFAAGEEGAG
jgi:hypothetical protein